MTESLTVDVLLHPGEGDAALLAALTEAEQEGAWGLWAQDGPLPLFADEAHDVPARVEHTESLVTRCKGVKRLISSHRWDHGMLELTQTNATNEIVQLR